MDVIITYNEKADLAAETVKEIEALGVKATALQVNFADSKNIPALVEGIKATLVSWGKTGLDILINNAGTLRLGMFDSLSMDDLDAVYNTNYKSVFYLTQQLLPILNNDGRIVNLSSGTAKIAFGPLVSYGPMKAALQSLTLYL